MKRVETILYALQAKGIDGILLSNLKNIRYISGFTGSSACMLIHKSERLFFTDFRYKEQAAKETSGFEIVIEHEERPREIMKKAKAIGIRTLGCESSVSYEFYKKLLRRGVRIKVVNNLIEDMRTIKDRAEIHMIKKAIYRAELAFRKVKPFITKGSSERRIAALLEENLKIAGCSVLPFDIIVVSGAKSSLPHARPSDNKITAGELVVIDWGGEAGGYFSDMTRTFLIGGRNIAKQKEMYDTVLLANRKAIEQVRVGSDVREVDRAARDVIKKAGYGDCFGHGTGHGVGLDVHELPKISRIGKGHIAAGMVFTIEPGIYVPGLGGVRIEDMVLASKSGCRMLTDLPRRLEIIH